MAAMVMNDAGILQVSGGHRHALAAPAQHACQELLRHRQFRMVYPVMAHQQPPAQALRHAMQTIADGGLGNLSEEGLRISQ